MALYKEPKPQIKRDTNDEYFRTNTNLTKDQGRAPSFEKLVDPRLPKLFKFEYGGQRGWVVMPKGRIVSVVPDRTFKHFDDNKFYPALTLANGGEDVTESNDNPDDPDEQYTRVANKPVGVASLNVYQDVANSFEGNRPGFITRNSINLPLFADKDDAEKMEWGSAYGKLKPGDKVMSDENGRFVKWTGLHEALDSLPEEDQDFENAMEAADPADQIVGMVLSLDENLIPAGWLKWVYTEQSEFTEFGRYTTDTGFTTDEITDDGYPYDPSYGRFEKERPTGVCGILDGMNYIKEYKRGADDEKEGEDGPVQLGEMSAGFEVGDTATFRMREHFMPVEEIDHIWVVNESGDDIDVASIARVDADEKNSSGMVRFDIEQDVSDLLDAQGSAKIEMEFKARHQMPGMPTHMDFEGVIGSVDILLQM